MPIMPPGYHIKCSFCDKTEGPFPTVDHIEALIVDTESEWMEIRTGGEEFHCCTSDHFSYPASSVIPDFFQNRKKETESPEPPFKQESYAKIRRRGF